VVLTKGESGYESTSVPSRNPPHVQDPGGQYTHFALGGNGMYY
jgi:hypothetical protein